MRRFVTAAVIAIATLPVTLSPSAAAPVPVLVIDGRGFGHGVGMAQDGAYWMGAAGARTEQILGQFYPGTTIGRGSGPVRVAVGDVGPAPTSVVLGFPSGGELRDNRSGEQSPGFPVQVPAGGAVRIVWNGGRYRVERADGPVAIGRPRLVSHVRPQIDLPGATTTTTAPAPTTTTSTTQPSTTTTTAPVLAPSPTTTEQPPSTTTTAPPSDPNQPAPPAGGDQTQDQAPTSSRSIWAVPANNGTVSVPYRQRAYRGLIEATAAAGPLRLVNEVDVETYLKGMGEVRDPRWPPAALRAQAIAARTYALRAMLVGGGEICDTQRCQVYLGAQAEYGAMNKAVDDTRGQVLAYGRQLASAVYSANGGGFSASRQEGFGVPDNDGSAPYLRPAPYLTKDPAPWNVTVDLATLAARLGYGGAITNVTPSKTGPSGRVMEVTIDGTAGPKPVPGIAFDAALGLKSTLFTMRMDVTDAPPPPPPPAEALIQAPPEQAAAAGPAPAGADVGPAAQERASRSRASARQRIEIDPTPPRETTGDEMAAVFGSWAAMAMLGAGVLLTDKRVRAKPWQTISKESESRSS